MSALYRLELLGRILDERPVDHSYLRTLFCASSRRTRLATSVACKETTGNRMTVRSHRLISSLICLLFVLQAGPLWGQASPSTGRWLTAPTWFLPDRQGTVDADNPKGLSQEAEKSSGRAQRRDPADPGRSDGRTSGTSENERGEVSALPPSQASDLGSSYSIITQQQIQASGKVNVAEVLREVVGVDVVRHGGPGGLQSVFIRGANCQHTKVLLDGVPINDPSSPTRGFDFSTMDVENIERIEVVRGPQSLLYGSDAMGGVVNIITTRGEGPFSLRATGRGGTFGTSRGTLSLSGGGERLYYSLGGAFTDTAGVSQAARSLGNTERDGYGNGTLSGRFGCSPVEWLNVDYVFRWADVEAEVDDYDFLTGLPVDNYVRHNLSQTFYQRVQLQSALLGGILRQSLAFDLAHYDRDDTDPEPLAPTQFTGETRQIRWQSDLALVRRNTLSVGLNFLQENAENTDNPSASQNDVGLFVMDQLNLWNVWYMSVGTRWDEWNTAGSAQTYRWTNLLRLGSSGAAVHGSVGTGFRAPALSENLFAYGNPSLRPERSKGWDIGLRQELLTGRIMMDATYFRNDLTDLIVFDVDTLQLENVGRARTTGVELSAEFHITDGYRIRAEYTYTDPIDLDTNTQLLRRPVNKASVQVGRSVLQGRARVDVELLYVDRRLDLRDAMLAEYYLLNLTSTYELSDHWSLFLRGANLLDERYEEVYGYGTEGIACYAGLDLVF